MTMKPHSFNTLVPEQNGLHFVDDTFKCIFMNENFCTLIQFSLRFVPNDAIDSMSVLFQVMTWYQKTTSPWWRHLMETFAALLTICAGNSLVTGEFPSQRPVTRSFDIFFDLCLKQIVEQTMETPVIWDASALIMTSEWWLPEPPMIRHWRIHTSPGLKEVSNWT